MNTVKPMYKWNKIPWRKLEKIVYKLQKRIYQAALRGDVKALRKLQKLLMKSWAAKCLAVRRVTQDNKGKKTAGVDGVKSLTPTQRLDLVNNLKLGTKVSPTRRVWIEKPGREEKRPLGIPTMKDRALQALTKLALEPEWEAYFEENSYGFRPGRSCHDAIVAIFNCIRFKPKYVLDADIASCFDKIDHEALLTKLNTSPTIRRQIRAWLKAGVIDSKQMFSTLEGTPQGGVLSPLLANIALHGMEKRIKESFPRRGTIKNGERIFYNAAHLVRYADDFVILHEDITVVQKCKEIIFEWLKDMGLELKPSKTKLVHTLNSHDGEPPGFDFLGFNIRQHKCGKYTTGKNSHGVKLGFRTIITSSKDKVQLHLLEIAQVIDKHKALSQVELIHKLNPIIIGWCNYYRAVSSCKIFYKLDFLVYQKLRRWANRRHPNKNKHWVSNKYWQTIGGDNWVFATRLEGTNPLVLRKHGQTKMVDHTKVKGESSPYDGNLVYWSTRMGQHPEMPKRMATLLKKQKGKCAHCGLHFKQEDVMEVDHKIPKSRGGKDNYDNWQLLHRHCHDTKTATDSSYGTKSGCNSAKPKPSSELTWFWEEDMLVMRYV
ncbi:group II intron reverse transcriptase/maturase [Tolypothrix sp. PCC 7910]|uniref:group II intron reverse transcriptase/maturase n=1 Tax=Tolypothrix sp. PCC 7910 TaxID=2099387 RepID=UPI0014277C92|nr:group II intron reverse transcriptase/maturase [Tolypothrix sp. PCC 7910]QIR37254.1 group II intron reverse transcriptase/maturase [Tolypothrix sp. PCC 7910]